MDESALTWRRNNISRRARGRRRSRLRYYAIGAVIAAVIFAGAGFLYLRPASTVSSSSSSVTSSTTSTLSSTKPIILYIDQGNGAVNQSNFGSMLSFSIAQGFNTIFFQIYREGSLLFTTGQLSDFVTEAHAQGLKIFFALYFTNSSQPVPSAIFPLGEDGISLDMSTLPISTQSELLATVKQGFQTGKVAITTTDFTLPLTPDLLVLETYGSQYDSFIHPGIVASVGVFATTSKADYEEQFQYALQNSDGVMVFDYAGLLKSGY